MAHLPEADPGLAALSLWCRVVDGEDETRTAGEAIRIGSDFEASPLREQIGLLGHHILHIALRHEQRMAAMAQRWGDGFQAQAYNLAADAIVNECLEQAGHAIPRPAPTLSALLAEVLRQPTEGALSRWDVDRLYVALTGLDGDGRKRRVEFARNQSFQEDIAPDVAAGADQEDAEWRAHLTRAQATAGAMGRGVGALLGDIADLPSVSTPWEIHLRRLLSYAVREAPRQSYSCPQRSWLAQEAAARRDGGPAPVFQPGLARNARRARIVVGLDTSGSISDPVLALFAAEAAGVARRTGAELHVLAFDETVHGRFEANTEAGQNLFAKAQMRREGGTSYEDVLAEADALAPSIIVVLTDLDGAFGSPPKSRIIWATPQVTWSEPPFGDVLTLSK